MYIFRINLMISSDENAALESRIVQKIEEVLVENKVELVSTTAEDVYGNNIGRCSKCGCWVSDHTQPDYIALFSNGAQLNNKWYCDMCLPKEHPNAF